MCADIQRCAWTGEDELYQDYHDTEWGVPVRDSRLLFEFLCLEGAQAGLSWITILRKREGYRQLFDGFDPVVIAGYGEDKIEALQADARIIRNQAKIRSVISNANGYLEMEAGGLAFTDYIWSFVDGEPIQNSWSDLSEIPASTEISSVMSKDLKRRGFNFVGPTICYAFMQAAGLVNDHVVDCFRWQDVQVSR